MGQVHSLEDRPGFDIGILQALVSADEKLIVITGIDDAVDNVPPDNNGSGNTVIDITNFETTRHLIYLYGRPDVYKKPYLIIPSI